MYDFTIMKKCIILLSLAMLSMSVHAHTSPPPQGIEQSKQASKTFSLFGVAQLSVPPTMELRKDSDIYSQTIPSAANKIVFQQRGLGDVAKTAFERYARIIVVQKSGGPGEYLSRHETISLSQEDKELLLDNFVYREFPNSFKYKLLGSPKLRWIDISGTKAIMISYQRTGDMDSTVNVYKYLLQDYDKMMLISISYRIQDASYFLPELTQAIQSFRWY